MKIEKPKEFNLIKKQTVFLAPGIYVQERGVSGIFMGPVNRPIIIDSREEFERFFGGH